jgi:hypothetical protein
MGDYELDMEMLKNICPIYNDTLEEEETNNNNTYNFTQLEGEMMLLKDKYFAKVEYGNDYINKLKDNEEEYFKRKYGEEIYNYMKDQRNKFVNSKINEICSSKLNIGNESMDINNISDISNLLPKLNIDISNEYKLYDELNDQDYNNETSNISNIINNTNSIKAELSHLYSKSSLDKRKIEYRQQEIQDINYYNNMITIIYFFILILYFLYLIINNELNIGRSWFVYIIIIIFPVYIYPVLFYYVKKLFNYLSINMELHGPKNAFINEDIKFDFLG